MLAYSFPSNPTSESSLLRLLFRFPLSESVACAALFGLMCCYLGEQGELHYHCFKICLSSSPFFAFHSTFHLPSTTMLSRATYPTRIDHIGILHELCQVARGSSIQDTYTSVGMDHLRIWTCTLTVTFRGNRLTYTESGCTKKDAKDRCVTVTLSAFDLS